MARIAVVVPVLNNFKGCTEALQSIRTVHDWTPIIISQWRKQLPLSAAWNIGILEAKERGYDYVLVINDDILCSRYSVDNLVRFLSAADPDILMITGCNDAGKFPNPYDILTYEADLDITNFRENPDFSFFLVRPNICELVGAFDENFYPAFVEDNEMHFRINLLGYRAGTTSSAPYYHFGSVTGQSVLSESFHEQFRKNQLYYERKWGGYIGDEKFKHPYNNPTLSPKEWIFNYWKHNV